MRWIADKLFRLRALLSRRSLEKQLDEEFAFHLQMEARKLRAEGRTPEDAESEARRRFGSDTRERERARDSWGVSLAYEVGADVRHALRQYLRRPGFTAVAVLTLAIGLGGTVAIFSAVRGLVLEPLPYRDESRLHVFWFDFSWRGSEFDYLRQRPHGFEGMAAYSADGVRYETSDETRLLVNVVSSAELFDVLGARPALGRTFEPGEDRPGAEPVVVISHGFWQQEMGADPAIVGRRLQFDGVPTTVIGVMPPEFHFPNPQFRIWRPLVLDPATPSYRNNGWLTIVARSRPGRTAALIQQDIDAVARSLGEQFTYTAQWDKSKNASVTPLRDYLMGDAKGPLTLLLSAVGALLLMGVANAAALVLARTTDRREEMALRVALGAGRARLARQVITESVTLSLLAATLGALIAAFSFRVLAGSLPIEDDLRGLLTLEWSTFATGFVLAVFVGLGVAVIPVRHLLRGRVDSALGRARTQSGSGGGTRRAHSALVAGEVALAMLLVVGAMLMIRSVDRLRAIDPGFEPAGVHTFDVVASTGNSTPQGRGAFFGGVLERVRALPGVRMAGMTNRLPIRDGGWQGPATVSDRPDLSGPSRPTIYYRVITPGFLEALGAAVAQGRDIEPTDRAGGLQVALVNESLARRMWPGESAIGKRLSMGMDNGGVERNVVGVVRDIRLTGLIGENALAIYVPLEQSLVSTDALVLAVRHDGPASALIAAVRRVVHDMDPRSVIIRPGPLDRVISQTLSEPLRLRFFLALFGALALGLGAIGVYGVVAYAVARRHSEFGLRMALGASPARVLREVIRDGLIPVGVGLALGTAGALSLARILSAFVYGISATDVVSLAWAAVTLLAAGVLASLVPAWRAGRVSPREALLSA